MADRNWDQQFIVKPAAAAQNNDLFYLARSPYANDGSDDFVINWQNLLASIAAQIQSGLTWVDVVGTSQAMLANHGYVTDNVGLITFTLPATSVLGDSIKIVGFSSGLYTISISGQSIHMGTAVATSNFTSTQQGDCMTLRCVVPDSEWLVEASQGNFTFA